MVWEDVAKKRSNLPELKVFGTYLRVERGGRSREQIAKKLRALGVKIDESTLVQYERGSVWSPDAAVLQGLAEIYGMKLAFVIGLLRANRAKPEATHVDQLEIDLTDLVPNAMIGDSEKHLLTVWAKLPEPIQQHLITIIEYIAEHGTWPATKEAQSA